VCAGARSLLDPACGTGRHVEYLTRWHEVEGPDADPAMLEHRCSPQRHPAFVEAYALRSRRTSVSPKDGSR
jgi:SAM-dependent methyltransferase